MLAAFFPQRAAAVYVLSNLCSLLTTSDEICVHNNFENIESVYIQKMEQAEVIFNFIRATWSGNLKVRLRSTRQATSCEERGSKSCRYLFWNTNYWNSEKTNNDINCHICVNSRLWRGSMFTFSKPTLRTCWTSGSESCSVSWEWRLPVPSSLSQTSGQAWRGCLSR